MSFTIVHEPGHMLRVSYHNMPLLHYVYVPDVPTLESPRPYIHPLYTLNGDLITDFQPADHCWHHGLSMTIPYLDGENFWGGPTYLRDQGYQQRANNGQQLHQRWLDISQDEQQASLKHSLLWQSQQGQDLMQEIRDIQIDLSHRSEGYWCLVWRSEFENISGQALSIGSPGTEGRTRGGYGNLFWRGPQSFCDGRVLLSDGRSSQQDDESLMGANSNWLAYYNPTSLSNSPKSLIFVDQPDNPRYPNEWFLRAGNTPMVCFALSYSQRYLLAPQEKCHLQYQIIIADGAWDKNQIEAAIAAINHYSDHRKEDFNG